MHYKKIANLVSIFALLYLITFSYAFSLWTQCYYSLLNDKKTLNIFSPRT